MKLEMACCPTNKREFLLTKARNFRDFINRYEPAEEIVTYMSSFEEDKLVATLLAVVVPIVQTKTTGSAVKDLAKKLKIPEDERASVENKLERYLEMFASVLLA